jgi:ribosomal-protein-alanine N-acetyltransferase
VESVPSTAVGSDRHLEALTVLETPRLRLRRMTTDDAPFILELLNDPGFLTFIGDRGVRTLDDAVRYLQQGPLDSYARHGHGLYLVEPIGDGEPAGMCGLLYREHLQETDIGYAFLPRFRGRGYALEAAAATLDYGRRVLGKTRIIAIVSPGNDASIAVLEKLGMRYEKRMAMPAGDEVLVFA